MKSESIVMRYHGILSEIASGSTSAELGVAELFSGSSLAQYTVDLDSYFDRTKTEVATSFPGVSEKIKTFFLLLNELDEVIAENYRESGVHEFDRRINVAAKLFAKSRRTLLEAIPLIEHGASISIYMLWRSIYNDYVISKFVLSRSEDIAANYNDFSSDQLSKIRSTPGYSEKSTSDGLRSFERNDYAWSGLEKSQRSFSAIAALVGEKENLAHYSAASMYHHASPFSVNQPFFRTGKLNNTNSIGLLFESLPFSLNLMINTLLDICELNLMTFLPVETSKELLVLLRLCGNKAMI